MPTTLLTGLPRSGTTLVCVLLNRFANTVALAEPIALGPHGDRARAVVEVDDFIATTRYRALHGGMVMTKHVDGVVAENMFEAPDPSRPGLRRQVTSRGEVAVGKPLDQDFALVVKHPAEFSALADLLRGRYPLLALVRHPLAVLAAWQTVDMPVNRGHMPMAEAFHPGIKAKVAAIPDTLTRQLALIEWLFDTYGRFPPGDVFRYEDVVRAPDALLGRLTPYAEPSSYPLQRHDPARRYAGVDLARLARELRAIRPVVERFYPDLEQPWPADAH